MCGSPCGGGGSKGQAQAQSAQSSTTNVSTTSNTSVTVPVTTNVNFPTADLANAIQALAGAGVAQSIIAAEGQVEAASIAAHAGPSTQTIILVIVAVAGLAFTAGFIKLPRELRA